jgi:hypothetical protein
VHLVSTESTAVGQGRAFAISDGNAGAALVTFRDDAASLDDPTHLRWADINARQWQGKMHFKQAEFLVADRFDWTGISYIGCHTAAVAAQVLNMLPQRGAPQVGVQLGWYYG